MKIKFVSFPCFCCFKMRGWQAVRRHFEHWLVHGDKAFWLSNKIKRSWPPCHSWPMIYNILFECFSKECWRWRVNLLSETLSRKKQPARHHFCRNESILFGSHPESLPPPHPFAWAPGPFWHYSPSGWWKPLFPPKNRNLAAGYKYVSNSTYTG